MRVLVLDGFPEATSASSAAVSSLESEARGRGWDLELLRPADLTTAPCTGCFECWEKTPGRCVQKDGNVAVLRAILRADLVFLITPVTFGGYSPELKVVFDRGIPLLLPFFRTVGGEIHHPMRYERTRSLAALGILPGPDPETETVFKTVVRRNAVNFGAGAAAARTVVGWASAATVADAVAGLLDHVRQPVPENPAIALLSGETWIAKATARLPVPSGGKRRALLLVGSPRTPSNSASLGEHLVGRLALRGWETVPARVPVSGRFGRWMEEAAAADLIVVAAPLYADALPTHLVRGLRALATSLRGASGRPRGLVGIVNCGFPEAHNNHTALAMLRLFARDAGLLWMGGLPLGMGEIVNRAPLASRGGVVRRVVAALDTAAEALDQGRAVPEEAVRLISRQIVPRWMYILGGNWGWRSRGRKNRVGDLRERPLETKD